MSGVTSSDDSIVDINELLNEFYDQPIGHSQLGEFESITSVPTSLRPLARPSRT